MTIDIDALKKIPHRRWPVGNGKKYSRTDIEFMDSLSAAVLSDNPSKTNILLYAVALVVISLIVWANYAELDERTQGLGRLIPSRQIQVIQNLEGGIIKEIKVIEGQAVKKARSLLSLTAPGPAVPLKRVGA